MCIPLGMFFKKNIQPFLNCNNSIKYSVRSKEVILRKSVNYEFNFKEYLLSILYMFGFKKKQLSFKLRILQPFLFAWSKKPTH